MESLPSKEQKGKPTNKRRSNKAQKKTLREKLQGLKLQTQKYFLPILKSHSLSKDRREKTSTISLSNNEQRGPKEKEPELPNETKKPVSKQFINVCVCISRIINVYLNKITYYPTYPNRDIYYFINKKLNCHWERT